MTQNPSWMMRELVESSKFQTFPPRRLWIRLLLPKKKENPHPLGAKIRLKLNNSVIIPRCSIPSAIKTVRQVQIIGSIQGLLFAQPFATALHPKNTEQTNSRIITVRLGSALRSLTPAPECAKVRRKHTRGSPSASSAYLRTRGWNSSDTKSSERVLNQMDHKTRSQNLLLDAAQMSHNNK